MVVDEKKHHGPRLSLWRPGGSLPRAALAQHEPGQGAGTKEMGKSLEDEGNTREIPGKTREIHRKYRNSQDF